MGLSFACGVAVEKEQGISVRPLKIFSAGRTPAIGT